MAVRAEQDEVLDPVVKPVAVAVVQLKREWATSPVAQAAVLTGIREQACLLEPLLEMPPVTLHAVGEDHVDRGATWAGQEITPTPGCVEGRPTEAVVRGALRNRAPLVVEHLHRLPVVAPTTSLVERHAGASRMPRNRRLRDPQAARDLCLRCSLLEQL